MDDEIEQPIDELFTKIRLKLLDLRQADPETVEELKNLIIQLEDWVQSLVVDSLRLKELKSKKKK